MRKYLLVCLAMVGTLAGSGCTLTTNDTANDGGTSSAGNGHLNVYWTISGGKDPNACTTGGASYARIDLLDLNGLKVNSGSESQACSAFGTTFATSFIGGTYTARITLLAADNATAVTTTASTTVVVPSDGTTATTAFDFSAASFLASTTTGKLNVYWTIAGSNDTTGCSSHYATYAKVDVYDSAGTLLNGSADTQTCSAMGTSFTTGFNPGAYSVKVTLVGDDSSTARTTTVTSSTTIAAGATATVNVDFPVGSFF